MTLYIFHEAQTDVCRAGTCQLKPCTTRGFFISPGNPQGHVTRRSSGARAEESLPLSIIDHVRLNRESLLLKSFIRKFLN